MRGEREYPRALERLPRVVQRCVHRHRRQIVVVQAGPAHLWFGQVKPHRLDQVQFASGGRHHPDRVAGVGRDARGEE